MKAEVSDDATSQGTSGSCKRQRRVLLHRFQREHGPHRRRLASRTLRGKGVVWAPQFVSFATATPQALCRDQPGLARFGSDLLVSTLGLTVTVGTWWNSHGLGFCFAIIGQVSRCSVKWADRSHQGAVVP